MQRVIASHAAPAGMKGRRGFLDSGNAWESHSEQQQIWNMEMDRNCSFLLERSTSISITAMQLTSATTCGSTFIMYLEQNGTPNWWEHSTFPPNTNGSKTLSLHLIFRMKVRNQRRAGRGCHKNNQLLKVCMTTYYAIQRGTCCVYCKCLSVSCVETPISLPATSRCSYSVVY